MISRTNKSQPQEPAHLQLAEVAVRVASWFDDERPKKGYLFINWRHKFRGAFLTPEGHRAMPGEALSVVDGLDITVSSLLVFIN